MVERSYPVTHGPPYEGPMTIDASLLHALWCYGILYPVTGVVYSYGAHQKALDDADKLLYDRAQKLAALSSDGSACGGSSQASQRHNGDLQPGGPSETLLPCPFCGGKPFLHGPDNPGHEYWISCQSCQASSLMRSNYDATRAAWNARPLGVAQPPMAADIEQILSEGYANGKTRAEIAEEILREFAYPGETGK
jgi:Lar family restriction alleviation protein